MASTMPMARTRRWASTVKPPTETSAISSMPRVASVSTTVSGLIALLWLVDELVVKSGPSEFTTPLGPSKRTSTWLGDGTCPGATSANSSSRLCGFCTKPTTRRDEVPACQTSPRRKPKVDASAGVRATSPGPLG